MAVYSYIFGVIVAVVSYLVYQKYANVYTSVLVKPEKRYDYIIGHSNGLASRGYQVEQLESPGLLVGAGAAGCVLAARLSEDPTTKVLLVEAGNHMGYLTRIPLTPTAAQQGPDDWSVRTTPQKYSSFGLWDQTQILPRGKGLGGSGQINFLLHGFGLPEDYDRWSRQGLKGWSLEDLRPYFVKAFGTARSEFDSEHCSLVGYCPGSEAPMKLKRIAEDNDLMRAFKEASQQIANKNTIFRKATATIKDGERHSSFDAYLKPVLNRRNLHVLLKTKAISIRFDNNTASSLYVLQNHRDLLNVFVNKEIILCAGAIKTPQILMLSGVGPKKLIQKMRIKLIALNEQVGKNLHDHMNMPIYVSIKQPISISLAKVFTFSTLWEYYWNSGGLLSFPPLAGVEYQNTSAVMLFSMGTASERLLRDLSNYHPKVFRDTFPFYNQTAKEGFMFLATCIQPRSRGTVSLKDSSTSTSPVVDPNYLYQTWDVRCIVKAIRRAEHLVSTKPFKDMGATIHWPRPERCLSFWRYSREDQTGVVKRRKKFKPQGVTPADKHAKFKKEKPAEIKSPPDAYLECIIREVAVTGHHVGGTAAGGTVVDDQLRVKSVSGVRVVDASVLPSPVSLYPNSVLIAMAEKAADLIRNVSVNDLG